MITELEKYSEMRVVSDVIVEQVEKEALKFITEQEKLGEKWGLPLAHHLVIQGVYHLALTEVKICSDSST